MLAIHSVVHAQEFARLEALKPRPVIVGPTQMRPWLIAIGSVLVGSGVGGLAAYTYGALNDPNVRFIPAEPTYLTGLGIIISGVALIVFGAQQVPVFRF